jgi:hypothetical protein
MLILLAIVLRQTAQSAAVFEDRLENVVGDSLSVTNPSRVWTRRFHKKLREIKMRGA